MKNLFFLFLTFSLLLPFGCKKYEMRVADNSDNGIMTAEFNNRTDWEATGSAKIIDDKLFLGGIAYVETNEDFLIMKEFASFENLPIGVGKYNLEANDSSNPENKIIRFRTIWDADVSGDKYVPRANKDNWIRITEIDTLAGFVRGTFELNLEIEDADNKTIPSNPDKIKLKDGRFDILLTE